MATNAHEYSIWIAEYARVQEYPVGGAIYGQHNAGTLVLPYCYGVLKSDEHTILVDTGFDNADSARCSRTRSASPAGSPRPSYWGGSVSTPPTSTP